MELGVVGLGKMGTNFSLHAARKKMRVVGTSKTIRADSELREAGVVLANSIEELVQELTESPRKIFLYLPAGPTVDSVIHDLSSRMKPGDILIDAGNSHFRDSQHRAERLAKCGIGFVDCGSSGGPIGALEGACFMVGGEEGFVREVEPILTQLAVAGGYFHAGPSGAGHFVKLVHNAIEFGMVQAIAEGVSLLEASEFKLHLPEVFRNWSHGSVIRGWLVELMEKGLREHQELSHVASYVEDTGEVNWMLQEAIRLEIPIPVIAMSVMELFASRSSGTAHRAVALLRHEFGQHPFGPSEPIAEERKRGFVGTERKDAA